MAGADHRPLENGSFAERLDALRDLNAVAGMRMRTGPLTPQQRGYRLEGLLHDLMNDEGLEPRSSFHSEGEQIDGSFVLDGRVMLLEAKWHAEPLPASAIYAFKGKVDGKLVGTVGLLLAMGAGFSEDAVTALTRGKDLSVILADDADLTATVSLAGTFKRMVHTKLRAAAETSVVYSPYRVAVDGRRHEPADVVMPTVRRDDAVAFVVEGPRDERIVGVLGSRVLTASGHDMPIDTYVGLGRDNSLRLAASIREVYGPAALVGVVLDADYEDPEQLQARLGVALHGRQIPIVAIPRTIERTWLGIAVERLDAAGWDERIEAALRTLDLDELGRRESSFARFAALLKRHAAHHGGAPRDVAPA